MKVHKPTWQLVISFLWPRCPSLQLLLYCWGHFRTSPQPWRSDPTLFTTNLCYSRLPEKEIRNWRLSKATYITIHDNFRFPGNFWIQLNLSTMATKESGCCREVRFFITWTPHSQVLVDTISRYSVNIIISQISVKMSGKYQLVCQSTSVGRVSVDMLADILAISWLGEGRHVSQEVSKLQIIWERWPLSRGLNKSQCWLSTKKVYVVERWLLL